MAARDNQGLQIALIIFVMLTIVLSVTTFMFFRKFEEAELKEKAATNKTTEALKNQTVAQEEAIALKKILGAGPRDNQKTIEDNAKEDMKTYGGNFKDTDQHYRQLVKYLYAELAASNALFVDAKQYDEQLKAKIAAEERVKLTEIAQYTTNLDKSVTDLKGERTSFNQSRDALKEVNIDIATLLKAKQHETDNIVKKMSDEIQGLTNQVVKLTQIIREMQIKLWDKEQFADLPRGKITWVNQRSRIVWLNVGSADGLRRQITFKVLAADETNLANGKKKGSLEVTRLLDKHLAEARILDDDLSDPLMPGDQIFSQIWIPGRVEHFALLGFMDIDGDHESDRKTIKQLLAVNGGVVDAEVGDDGKRTGELTLNTRYLVLGSSPTDKSNSTDFIQAYSGMTREADSMGVKKISLEEFLDNMGYQPEERTQPMDSKAQSADFKAQPLDGVLRQSNAFFKARRPASTATKPSAY